jgi:bile acid:Na+ symporter, BASS family
LLAQVGIAVVLLNVLAMLMGFWMGKLFNLRFAQRMCVAIEVGIQNGTLAIVIAARLLNNPDMVIPAVIYSLMMYVTAISAISYGRRYAQANQLPSQFSED